LPLDTLYFIDSKLERCSDSITDLWITVKAFLKVDWILFFGLLGLLSLGLAVLYSAGNGNLDLVIKQGVRICLALVLMLLLTRISPLIYCLWAPWFFIFCIVLLTTVLAIGVIGKGAQRWINLGLVQFQPSELMKLAVPMMLAWYLHDKQLPPSWFQLLVLVSIIAIPTLLVAKQPDLGTALLIAASGFSVIFISGISARLLQIMAIATCIIAPIAWHSLHDYQRTRVLTFLNPERDPLGAGYHIIQSKIAIGSGGFWGKGWLHGTQSHLLFLPEHTTDFIFSVWGEESGFFGSLLLLLLYFWILGRCVYISMQAQDTFSRLLSAGLALTFFIAFFINIAMVTGLVPVVGVPLPLISYGGTSLITLVVSFGLLMSIHTHRKLLGK